MTHHTPARGERIDSHYGRALASSPYQRTRVKNGDGTFRTIFVATCTNRCGNTAEIGGATDMSIETLGKKFGQRGWDCDQNGKRAICPDCIAKRHRRQTFNPPHPPTVFNPTLPVPTKQEPKMAATINPPRTVPASPAPSARTAIISTGTIAAVEADEAARKVAAEPRELTPREVRQVNALLETHFDDDVGKYLNGYSDQRIADELDLPRLAVAKLRVAAFGEIRVDPLIERELDSIRAAIKVQADDFTRLMDQFMDKQAALETRLGLLTKKIEG